MFSCLRQNPVSICLSADFLWSKPFMNHSQLNTSTVRQETVNVPTMSYLDFSMLIPHACLSNSHNTDVFTQLQHWPTMQCITATGWVRNYAYLLEKLKSRCPNENAIRAEHLLISDSNYTDSTLIVTRGQDGSDGQWWTNGVGCGEAVCDRNQSQSLIMVRRTQY